MNKAVQSAFQDPVALAAARSELRPSPSRSPSKVPRHAAVSTVTVPPFDSQLSGRDGFSLGSDDGLDAHVSHVSSDDEHDFCDSIEPEPGVLQMLRNAAALIEDTLPSSDITPHPPASERLSENPLRAFGQGPSSTTRARSSVSHLLFQRRDVLAPLDRLNFQGWNGFFTPTSLKNPLLFLDHGCNFGSKDRLTSQEVKNLSPSSYARPEIDFLSRQNKIICELNKLAQHSQALVYSLVEKVKSDPAINHVVYDLIRALALHQPSLDAQVCLLSANNVLRERDLRLKSASLSETAKESLRSLPLFDKKLFPSDTDKLFDDKVNRDQQQALITAVSHIVPAHSQVAVTKSTPAKGGQPSGGPPNRGRSRSRRSGGNSRGTNRGRGRGAHTPAETVVRPAQNSEVSHQFNPSFRPQASGRGGK